MLKYWFFGTGKFAARCLERMAERITPALVVTIPPTVKGRGKKKHPSPVELKAVELGLPVTSSENVTDDSELKERLKADMPDVLMVIDFGQKIGEPWLSACKNGCINIHPSMLPEYRGAAPVQRALIDGRTETGVTLFRLAEKMDAGDVWHREKIEIGENETADELLMRSADIGSEIFISHVWELEEGSAEYVPQDGSKATIAAKIDKRDAELDLTRPASELHCKVRGFSPAPGAFFLFRGKRMKVLKTALMSGKAGTPGTIDFSGDDVWLNTGEGRLQLVEIQPEGKRPMPVKNWLCGARLENGEKVNG